MNRILGVIFMMIAATNANAAAQGLPRLMVPDCLGVNIHFVGNQAEEVGKIADGGFKFIRMDFSWVHIEKEKGVYDFKPYDELVDSLEAKNIRALFILAYGNPLYDNDMSPHTDEGRTAFVRFITAGAKHFKGKGVLWEIWNEPNIFFWRPQPNVEDYVKLAKAVYPALKKADPDCTVLAPALSGWDYGFLDKAFQLGLLEATDVVSLHPYGAGKPEDATSLYIKVRELIGKYAKKGRQYPIVSGEWGYSSYSKGVSVETQADFITRQFLNNIINNVALSIWYDWRDDGPDPDENEHHFGTVARDMSDKPAYVAAKNLNTVLNGYSFASRVSVDSEEDYLALFKKGDALRLAAWTTGKLHKVKLPLDVKEVEVISRDGAQSKAEVKDGYLEIELTQSPQYITPVGSSRTWSIMAAWQVTAEPKLTDKGLVIDVESSVDGVAIPGGKIDVSGTGITSAQLSFDDADAAGNAKTSTSFISPGTAKSNLTAVLEIKGLSEPIKRVITFTTSVCPRVVVLPPTDKELLFDIYRPSVGSEGPISGKLTVDNVEGVTLIDSSVEFRIPKGQDRVTIRAKTKQQPVSFTAACNLYDAKGRNIVRMPAGRYEIIETFAVGKPGDRVMNMAVTMDGDPKVKGEATLTYADAGAKSPVKICAKLDYLIEPGWKFVRVYKEGNIPIDGKPTRLGFWLNGNNGTGMARLRIVDAGQETFQPDLGPLSFTGWQCLFADLTGAIAGHWGGKNTGRIGYPIAWDTLFLFDHVGAKQSKDTLYLGPAMLYYE